MKQDILKAVEYLKKNRIAVRFNDYFGGYMIWNDPEKQSMDPRATVYPIDIVIDGYKMIMQMLQCMKDWKKRDKMALINI